MCVSEETLKNISFTSLREREKNSVAIQWDSEYNFSLS